MNRNRDDEEKRRYEHLRSLEDQRQHSGVYPYRYKGNETEGQPGYNDLDQSGLNELNGGEGRDYEQNAGYRENYNRILERNDWPEHHHSGNQPDLEHRQTPAGVTHRGKGPRSYQRSDDRIREDIQDMLMEDPYIDASEVEVTVQNGEVVLNGFVDTKQIKRRVEDVVESVTGVKEVQNQLRARMSGGQVVNIRNSQG